jgi:hypothetical protein
VAATTRGTNAISANVFVSGERATISSWRRRRRRRRGRRKWKGKMAEEKSVEVTRPL